uniref:NADH-ubiquinone oxidoreductase chain 6 n=1 Tax=Typhlatya monae TaxID=1173212 RepID=A0A1Z2R740_9EUCA|nr:NADH dehydrogenase subunit 6 [Typhlatya monae]ASA39525.1 NADH dehydrogenase subunit 6 [Typhlatya monae]
MLLLTFMIMLTSSISITFTKIIHPLAMGTTLLIQTTIISFMMTFTLKTTWFSYILFLIFLGAMLVLFIYVASLAPNEPLHLSYQLIVILTLTMILTLTLLIIDPLIMSSPVFTESTEMSFFFNPNSSNLSLNSMYNSSSMKMTLFLILYLLLTLVVVVKITSTHFGPLRLN